MEKRHSWHCRWCEPCEMAAVVAIHSCHGSLCAHKMLGSPTPIEFQSSWKQLGLHTPQFHTHWRVVEKNGDTLLIAIVFHWNDHQDMLWNHVKPPCHIYDVLVPPANPCIYRQISMVGNGSCCMLAWSQSDQDTPVELSVGTGLRSWYWYVGTQHSVLYNLLYIYIYVLYIYTYNYIHNYMIIW